MDNNNNNTQHLSRCLPADGKVYAFGGMGADTTPQALVRAYEAEKDQWQPLASMPTPRYGATPFVRGNKIYLMGKTPVSSCSFVCSLPVKRLADAALTTQVFFRAYKK